MFQRLLACAFVLVFVLALSSESFAQGQLEECSLSAQLMTEALNNPAKPLPKSYTDCLQRNAVKRLGRYLCVIEHAVGFQYGQKIIPGLFQDKAATIPATTWDFSKPSYSGKFLVEGKNKSFSILIEERPEKNGYMTADNESSESNLLAPEGGLATDYVFSFSGPFGFFEISNDNTFTAYRHNLVNGNKYFTIGKCSLV